MTPRWYALAGPAYLAALLALDTHASYPEQLALGVVTLLVLFVALVPLAPLVRAQALGVVVFATVGEVTGSLVWGV
jgi:predicted lysophospholipase L1 biosynthesis ABC-type transport system permease subunit